MRTKGGATKLASPAMRAYVLDQLTEYIAEALHEAYRCGAEGK